MSNDTEFAATPVSIHPPPLTLWFATRTGALVADGMKIPPTADLDVVERAALRALCGEFINALDQTAKER